MPLTPEQAAACHAGRQRRAEDEAALKSMPGEQYAKYRDARELADRQAAASASQPMKPKYWLAELERWVQVQVGDHCVAFCDPPA